MKKDKKSTKIKNSELTLSAIGELIDQKFGDFAVLMMKQFARIDEKFNKIDERFTKVDEDSILLTAKVSRIAEEQEIMLQKLDKINDKANNTFFLGQEVKRLEARLTKLEEER